MWRKIVGIVAIILGWGAVLAYILYASTIAKEFRDEQVVKEVVVSVVDSTETRQFASSAGIYRKLRREGFKFENQPIGSVDIVSATDFLRKSGYISDVDMYVTLSGKLVVNVDQHEPIVRLMTNGYNSYITEEGYTFRSPVGSAYYTAIITGTFRPLFASTFEGDIEEHYEGLIEQQEQRLHNLATKYSDLRHKERRCKERKRELLKDKRKGIFESKKNYEFRLVGVQQDLAKCDSESRQLKSEIREVERRQRAVKNVEQRLAKRYNDFCGLLDFVKRVEADDFWSAEIVQFVADTTLQGEIRLRLVPRSGDFSIEFGTLAMATEKMDKLRKFYDEGLTNMGWERFSKIDLRYNNQVICTE